MTTRRCFLTGLTIVGLLIAGVGQASAEVKPTAGMMRYPDVGKTHIVFSYANDLWLVPRSGGVATPLTSPPGLEQNPRFSADSQSLAFVGNYNGTRDLYTIPVTGGVPHQMTHNPGSEILCDWTPDGALLYATNAFSGLARVLQLVRVAEKNPMPVKLPVAYGSNGAISPDGNWLAFTPYSRDTRTWKRYRGGMASDIWLFQLKKKTAKKITDWEGTDTLPMWHEQTVYYLSDGGAEHKLNIWAYDTASGARRQITHFDTYDVKWPSIGPGDKDQGEIVFQYGPDLYLLDLSTGESHAVEVTVPGDRPRIMPHMVDAAKFITDGDISPSGKRIVLQARGDIWTLPAANGSPRNMTRTNGVAERYPSWSPDGRWIAYFADITGEYELYIKQSDGKGETRRLTEDGKVYRYSPVWSPDSKMIAFTDKTGTIYLHTIESGKTTKVDKDPWGGNEPISWSHDSTWIAYTKRADDRVGVPSIWLYEVASGKRHQVTDNLFHDSAPTFDQKGDYLFFASNRHFDSPMYEDLGNSFIYSDTELLVAMPLRKDVKNPLLPKSDEVTFKDKTAEKEAADKKKEGDAEPAKEAAEASEKPAASPPAKKEGDKDKGKDKDKDKSSDKRAKKPVESEKKTDTDKKEAANKPAQDDAKKPATKPEAKKTLTIDFDGILERSFALPAKNGSFSGLCVNHSNQLIYARRGGRGSGTKPAIQLFDLADPKPSEKTVVDGISQFGLSADGKKLLLMQGRSFFIVDAAPGQKLSRPVSTSGMNVLIDPRVEWKQIFTDAWRIERDFFYDPNMHHVNWPAIPKQYEKMLADCTSRMDVSYVIGEMISELNVGHAYYRGGDTEDENRMSVGLLGCEFRRTAGAYQVARFYEGAPWDVDARNPIRQAGVKVGDYVLAVNRVPVDIKQAPWAALEGLAGEIVILTVSSKPRSGEDDRDVVVKVLSSDSNLRYRGWIEHNRKYVETKSKGRVGYIYVPDTGTNGQSDLFRQFYGQMNKDALIIDERWNGGGQLPIRFIELLNRPVTCYFARRDGRDMTVPSDSHPGPKCMLINGLAGSGGDMFPALFREAKLGKLIGMRTWGGLVGITGNPSLIDGGGVTAPAFAFYEKDGTWGIEGHGVDPDIEVVDDPAQLARGVDPQLDAAIKEMLLEIKQHPYVAPKRPAYPDRSKMGIKPEDK